MKIIQSVMGGLAAALVGSSALAAGNLEIVYWGAGYLEWVRIDGQSFTVDDDTVTLKNVPEGSYSMEFGANGASRSLTLNLNSANYAAAGDWCVELELDEHEYLDDDDCEWMWDDYWWGE